MKNQKISKNLYTQNKEVLFSLSKLFRIRNRVSLKNNFKAYKYHKHLRFYRFLIFFFYKSLRLKRTVSVSPLKQQDLYYFSQNNNNTHGAIKNYVNFQTTRELTDSPLNLAMLKNTTKRKFGALNGSRLDKYSPLITNDINSSCYYIKMFLYTTDFFE